MGGMSDKINMRGASTFVYHSENVLLILAGSAFLPYFCITDIHIFVAECSRDTGLWVCVLSHGEGETYIPNSI